VSVGAVGTALHYVVLLTLVSGFGVAPPIGAMAGATCGAACNYGLNHRFTFQSDRRHRSALPRFVLMALVGILLNGIIVKTLTMQTINYLVSQVVATLLILALNFLVSKLWIFNQSR